MSADTPLIRNTREQQSQQQQIQQQPLAQPAAAGSLDAGGPALQPGAADGRGGGAEGEDDGLFELPDAIKLGLVRGAEVRCCTGSVRDGVCTRQPVPAGATPALQVVAWRPSPPLPPAHPALQGDFIFYSVLVGRAAMYDFCAVLSCYLAIIAGGVRGAGGAASAWRMWVGQGSAERTPGLGGL